MKNFKVSEITRQEAKPFILQKHYAQRMPSISWCFGLFHMEELKGVLTIGKPASNTLCDGLLGKKHSKKVFELNRLILDEGLPKNTASFFISRCLKKLKNKDLAIVSYADTAMSHHGYVYQASNFIYTGSTKERTDKYTPNNKHSRHYDNENSHLRKVRSKKHRYVFFTKNKELAKELKYPILPYPKGENSNYVLGERIKTKVIDKENNTFFYE
ncbi:acetyltransferase [Bacillus phage Riggi]|uniref:Acetyltransferase n=1 Tax=Bacillus phage Riggi TaxID=2884426 RepID=U5PWN7_9CAUD|nr:Mom-like DNA modification protein [Bacillus phage Riggi]AGY48171.1 acetyltransferase [Bacillus phage Riggi]